jgi:NodT family efflux transporter outer membrane factor (OMF) lipoprotein
VNARVVLCVALAGCRVGPDFAPPAPPQVERLAATPPATTVAAGRAQTFAAGGELAADWWTLFGSRPLDALVAACFAGNQDLAAARASVQRSQDSLRAGYGVFFPQLDAHAGASYQRATPIELGQQLPATTFGLYTVSGTISYTLDIWGGQRRQVEALGAQVDVARFTLAGLKVMLAANVANAVIARGAYAAEIATTRETVALEREQLRITQAQASGGTISFANVLAIQSEIAATEATIPVLEQKIDQAGHLIAVLTGRPPIDGAPDIALASLILPAQIPVSLPAELVRQRPDVLVAEAELHAATAQIGVATAAMLPNLSLTGSLGANNTALGSLFATNGIFAGIAGGLTAPLFHGGALYYQRRAVIDARDQAFASYRETVLTAFEQVADTLRGLVHDADALRAQQESLDSAQHALDLIQANYAAGIANYLQVIVANEQLLQAASATCRRSRSACRTRSRSTPRSAAAGGTRRARCDPRRRDGRPPCGMVRNARVGDADRRRGGAERIGRVSRTGVGVSRTGGGDHHGPGQHGAHGLRRGARGVPHPARQARPVAASRPTLRAA